VPNRRWFRWLRGVLVGVLALVAVLNLLLSVLTYVEVATANPRSRCERTYNETFNDGRVLEARRVAFPPSIRCRK
jgi:hypothetical protein